MNKIQINKIRMFEAVDLVLDHHSQLFSHLEDLVLVHLRLKSGLVLLGENREVQETDNSGLTDNKLDLRAILIRQSVRLSAAIKYHALSVKNRELWKKVNYTRSDLTHAKEYNLVDIGTLLLNLARPLQTELNRYLFGSDKLTDYSGLLESYRAAIPQKRVADSVSKVSTTNIGEMVDSLMTLLKEEADLLMLLLEDSQPDFYHAYKNARMIVDYGMNTNHDKGTNPPKDQIS